VLTGLRQFGCQGFNMDHAHSWPCSSNVPILYHPLTSTTDWQPRSMHALQQHHHSSHNAPASLLMSMCRVTCAFCRAGCVLDFVTVRQAQRTGSRVANGRTVELAVHHAFVRQSGVMTLEHEHWSSTRQMVFWPMRRHVPGLRAHPSG
jgi:hypothetical protein